MKGNGHLSLFIAKKKRGTPIIVLGQCWTLFIWNGNFLNWNCHFTTDTIRAKHNYLSQNGRRNGKSQLLLRKLICMRLYARHTQLNHENIFRLVFESNASEQMIVVFVWNSSRSHRHFRNEIFDYTFNCTCCYLSRENRCVFVFKVQEVVASEFHKVINIFIWMLQLKTISIKTNHIDCH